MYFCREAIEKKKKKVRLLYALVITKTLNIALKRSISNHHCWIFKTIYCLKQMPTHHRFYSIVFICLAF